MELGFAGHLRWGLEDRLACCERIEATGSISLTTVEVAV